MLLHVEDIARPVALAGSQWYIAVASRGASVGEQLGYRQDQPVVRRSVSPELRLGAAAHTFPYPDFAVDFDGITES